ncbi:hypothetical protein ACFVX3_32835 [Rhodococcus erythropolis]
MDVSDFEVVVWPESEEREAWWREIVGAARDATPAAMIPNWSVEDAPRRILHAA